jgi:hypothetical protein
MLIVAIYVAKNNPLNSNPSIYYIDYKLSTETISKGGIVSYCCKQLDRMPPDRILLIENDKVILDF